MITRETAAAIWSAYREIEAGEKLLADMAAERERMKVDRHAPTLRDAFGRVRQLQLGIPSGDNGHERTSMMSEETGGTARRWIVFWDDYMGCSWAMGRDEDCKGALCGVHSGKIVMFSSRAAARQAIKISTAYAKLRQAQGLPVNTDFLSGVKNVRIVECVDW